MAHVLVAAVFLVQRFAVAEPAAGAPPSAPERVVVMISIDGLAGDYIDDPKAEIPTLRALAAGGARAQSMIAVTPTVTWPNHTSLVTGDFPARHGVVGNNYLDRESGKKVTLIADPVYDKDQIVKVPTIYDLAKAKGMTTAAIRWPASRNAKSLDWTIPDVSLPLVLRKYSTAALLDECKAAGIWDGVSPTSEKKTPTDETWTDVFNLILTKHRPQLGLLHLADTDHMEHLKGPKTPDAYATIKEADAQVARVWELLKKEYPDKATLVIVSDHGFSMIEHMILPNVAFKKAGLVVTEGDKEKVTGGQVQIVSQGGSAMLYVAKGEDRDAIEKRVREALKDVPGVARIVSTPELGEIGVADPKVDPHAPDMVIYAADGYIFGDTAAGQLPFVEKPERKGSHGHDPKLPGLHATFIAWGAGIKPGVNLGEISNTDVAPTVARLLDLSMTDVDGKVLEAALSK